MPVMIACGASRNKQTVNNETNTDTLIAGTKRSLPLCIEKMIAQYKSEEKQNPPRSIYQYRYKGSTVYYVTAPCCDFFSDVYDSTCKMIGHPDGGFTGKGDGSMTDFMLLRTDEVLIWKDERK